MVQWSRMLSVEPHSEESLFHIILFRTSTVVQGCHYFFSFSLAFVASLALFFCFTLSSVFSPFFLSLHPSSPHIMVWMKFMDEVFVFVTYTLRFDTFVKCCWNITIIYRGLKSEIFGKLCAWKCTLVFFRHIYQAFIMESNCLCYL